MKIALAVAFMALMGTAYAYVYVAPIYTGIVGRNCVQPNVTYISCPDGSNISVAITVSAPYTPLLGNYTVWQVQDKGLRAVSGAYGGECAVGYGKSATCFVSVPAFSAFSGNGTVNESIALRIMPSDYPQEAYSENVSVVVNHYINGTGYSAVEAYQSAYSQYSIRSNAYSYACYQFGLCNSSIEEDIAFVNRTLSDARQSILKGAYGGSLLNISFAATELGNSNATFSAFETHATPIVQDVISGRTSISGAAASFVNNTEALRNCSSSNNTAAMEYLAGRVSAAESFPQPITQIEAQQYKAYADGLSANVSRIVASCSKSGTFSASAGFSLSMPGLGIGSAAEYIIIAIAIIVLALYVRSVLATRSEMRRIRGEHDGREKEEQDGKEKGQEEGEDKEDAGDGTEKAEHIDNDEFVQKISKGDDQ